MNTNTNTNSSFTTQTLGNDAAGEKKDIRSVFSTEQLSQRSGSTFVADDNGNYHFAEPVHGDQIISLASTILESTLRRGDYMTSPKAACDFARLQLGKLEHEVFAVLFLDSKHRLIAFEKLFTGTIDGSSVYPREIVKAVLRHNAAAVILTHNHPSGICEPSSADQALTQRLKAALALIDVRILDHVVVSATESTSMSERGLL
ncbi:DNA repair protein RadC [Gammaproteobacteria bacterium]|nr:DNA repair protein RadC [Gammaproteobacteria bacterium]